MWSARSSPEPPLSRNVTTDTDEIGRPASLEQVLAARERRAERQRKALQDFARPVVSLTLVMPGPVKGGPTACRIFAAARSALDALFARLDTPVLASSALSEITGPEALYVVDMESRGLKRALVDIETGHPLGRLWDADVICPKDGPVSRRTLGMEPRRCLICHEAAHVCARSRRHSLDELARAIKERVDAYRAA